MKTELSKYNNSGFNIGAGFFKRTVWYIVNILFFKSSLFPVYGLKVLLLRMFGAKLGKGVKIKPSVNIKYPWRLELGSHIWIGENVWIDNLDNVYIGDNCCISQGALLLCGNHNFKRSTFDLMTGSIFLEQGVWIGAMSVVCPNVRCHEHSILTVGSVATSDLEPNSIYQGNPATFVKIREIKE